MRPNAEARALAEREGVDIRTYRVIYQLTEDIQQALIGMLAPEQVEEVLGEVEVRQTFQASKLGTIAGCMVTSGAVQRGRRCDWCATARSSTTAASPRFGAIQDDVREVTQGFECGLTLEGYNDLKEGDVLEVYTVQRSGPHGLTGHVHGSCSIRCIGTPVRRATAWTSVPCTTTENITTTNTRP